MSERPLVAITMGDPAGIGAEVIAKALREGSVYQGCRPLVIGCASSMEAAVEVIGGGLAVRRIVGASEAAGAAGAIDVLEVPFGGLGTGFFSGFGAGAGLWRDRDGDGCRRRRAGRRWSGC